MKCVKFLVRLSECRLVNRDPASWDLFVISFPFPIKKDVAVLVVNLYPVIYVVGCVHVFCYYETSQLNYV